MRVKLESYPFQRFGTVSGVGIWFAIGLTHPEATSTLIHNFVFGWAMEWVFFLVELFGAPATRNACYIKPCSSTNSR